MQIECMLSNAVWGSAMEIQIPTRERKKTRLLIQCSLGRNWSTNEACHRFTAAQCDTHFFCWSKNDAFGADPVRWRIKKKQKLSRKSIPIHHIRNRTQALILKVSAVTFWSYPTACPWGFGTGFALACDNLHPITQILRHIPISQLQKLPHIHCGQKEDGTGRRVALPSRKWRSNHHPASWRSGFSVSSMRSVRPHRLALNRTFFFRFQPTPAIAHAIIGEPWGPSSHDRCHLQYQWFNFGCQMKLHDISHSQSWKNQLSIVN